MYKIRIIKFGATSTSDNKRVLVSISPIFRDGILIVLSLMYAIYGLGPL